MQTIRTALIAALTALVAAPAYGAEPESETKAETKTETHKTETAAASITWERSALADAARTLPSVRFRDAQYGGLFAQLGGDEDSPIRRRAPGRETEDQRKKEQEVINEGAPPPPRAFQFPDDHVPIPDRWRLVDGVVVNPRWWDPYNQNTLKGDRPIFGTQDWFVVLTGISDTVIEPRGFPLPVGIQTTERAGNIDVFGKDEQLVFAQTLIASIAVIQGSTAFKPQDLEFRITPAFQYNYVDVEERRILFVDPSRGDERSDWFIGMQEAFVDYHIRNVSDRYDFDSVRVGIQPFSTDFRGFLFQDNQLGIRLFGNRDNNRFQYNLAWFRRLEKDTNSGLNDIGVEPRKDDIFLANVYRQDFPIVGFTSQATVVYNRNREDEPEIDKNGFPARPALIGDLQIREYDVVYLGYNGDGRIGRLNLTASAYAALGENRNSNFTGETTDIEAFFVALEPSYDFNWTRVRLSGVYASGDSDPYDDTETGFDAIFENPLIAGADTSFWIRQNLPFIGGARAVTLNGRNGLLNSLRSSKEQGQSNFTNPGVILAGAGADFDIYPEFRLSLNANHLWFDDTSSLEVLRNQGGIDTDIGWDVSASAIYRPGFIQNFVFRLSGAALVPGEGFEAIYTDEDDEDFYYSVLFNAVITY